MPTVAAITQLLPDAAALYLFRGWEVIRYDPGNGLDAQLYGKCLVTSISAGAAPGSYNLDIRTA